MARSLLSSRLLSHRMNLCYISTACSPLVRHLSGSSATFSEDQGTSSSLSSLASTMNKSRQIPQPASNETSKLIERDIRSLFGRSLNMYNESARSIGEPFETEAARNLRETYYFHVYATKHNTHITVCTPKHEPMKKLSLSTGNIGFKKGNRGTYDAAYQLISFVLSRIVEQGNLAEMRRVEIVMRGFGVGREAVTKAILGQEGGMIRPRIVAVTDATRLKFGGTRSPKPRRLG